MHSPYSLYIKIFGKFAETPLGQMGYIFFDLFQVIVIAEVRIHQLKKFRFFIGEGSSKKVFHQVAKVYCTMEGDPVNFRIQTKATSH